VRPRELRAHVDEAGREVDVLPEEAEQLRDAHAAVDGGREQRPVAGQAGGQQPLDVVPAEHPLAAADGMRPLTGLELAHRIVDRPTVAEGEAQDAVQRRERAGGRLLRAALGAQGGDERGDIIDADRPDQTTAERRQQMPVAVVTVRLQRSVAPLPGSDPLFEARKPAARHRGEAQLRRDGEGPRLGRRDEQLALAARRVEVALDGTEARFPREHETDRVLAIGLPVDAALDTGPGCPLPLRSHRDLALAANWTAGASLHPCYASSVTSHDLTVLKRSSGGLEPSTPSPDGIGHRRVSPARRPFFMTFHKGSIVCCQFWRRAVGPDLDEVLGVLGGNLELGDQDDRSPLPAAESRNLLILLAELHWAQDVIGVLAART